MNSRHTPDSIANVTPSQVLSSQENASQLHSNLARWHAFVLAMQPTLIQCQSWHTTVGCHKSENQLQTSDGARSGKITAAISSPDNGLLQVFVQWQGHNGDHWALASCELRATGCATSSAGIAATEALLKECMELESVMVTHVDYD